MVKHLTLQMMSESGKEALTRTVLTAVMATDLEEDFLEKETETEPTGMGIAYPLSTESPRVSYKR